MNVKATLHNRAGRGERAFTMVEIAISIAIVAFALIAIIGVLPTGLNVQRDNREDTIIGQDAAFLMECIRSGPVHLQLLADNLEAVEFTTDTYDAAGNFTGSSVKVYSNNPPASVITTNQVISFLTQPKKYPLRFNDPNEYTVKLRFRAFSGNVGEQQGATRSAKDFAFSYFVTPEIRPFASYDPKYVPNLKTRPYPEDITFNFYSPSNTVASTSPPLTPAEKQRSNYWSHIRARDNNLFEVKLNFEWPVRSAPGNYMGVSGLGRHSFRTMVNSTFENIPANGLLHFTPGYIFNTVPITYP